MLSGLQQLGAWGIVLMHNSNKNHVHLKLQWKIFSFLLTFCALLLAILWFFQTVFLSDMYKMIRLYQTEQAIQLVDRNINSPHINDIFYQLEVEEEILVTHAKDFRLPPRGPEKRESITKSKAYLLDDGTEIELVFHAIVTPVEATIATLKVQLWLITAMMILLSIGIAWMIAKRIAKPIVQINESAKKLAVGDYETHFVANDFVEIKELSDTLNVAATELAKNEDIRRELMANISHDLRTPLALIYSYAEMMHDFPKEITPDQTRVIMEESLRLTSLVNDILDLSKLEEGVMTLSKQRYNLTEALQVTINRMSELIKKEGYVLIFEYDETIDVYADEIKMMQVFYNLLLNAVNHTGEDKTVTIKQKITQNTVRIEVHDTGGGIPDKQLPVIWERYYKIKTDHKRSITGTGLGLSIVKKIMDKHQGHYGVESKLGEGSTFWFELALEDTHEKK